VAKKIVVLGGGYAGVLTAKKLAKTVKKKKIRDVEITLIDRNPFHTMLTELHEVAAQRVEEDSIRIDLKRVFAGRDVNVVTDTVTEADYDGKRLTGLHGAYKFDYLVLASGSKPTFFGIPGAKEHSYSLWSYDDAVRLRERINEAFLEASREQDPVKKRGILTFFIVGAGFTGVEMAGELAELAPILCEKFGIDKKFVNIIEGDMLDRTVPVLPEKLSAKVQRRLEKMGVTLMLKKGICGIGDGWVEYKDAGSDKVNRLDAHTVIWTAGIEGSDISSAAGDLGQKGRGRVETDEYLRSLKKPYVYAAGDNVFYIPDGEKAPVPQMVENAEQSAHTVAHNIIKDITGTGEYEKYKPSFHGMMVCIGGKYGVAHVGLPGKFFGLPSFLAMFAKHFINIVYFIQVMGWNRIFTYLRHEFFTIRNTRSFVGGHLSNRTPSFLLMPLRVYLGFYWLYEGIVKILEGWFKHPSLTGFFSGANAWFDGSLVPLKAFNPATNPVFGAAAQAADAASSASAEWAGGAASAVVSQLADPVILDWTLLGFIRVILVNSGDVALKLKIGFVDWIINNVALGSDGAQMAFQIVIVCLEICVGLALMGGLFTTAASLGSIILMTMFLTSTGLYMETWWMFFASVAVLIGGGRALGLDYWVMPVLKKWWKNLKFIKKWYLYHD
jgi:NADH dehydrogenase